MFRDNSEERHIDGEYPSDEQIVHILAEINTATVEEFLQRRITYEDSLAVHAIYITPKEAEMQVYNLYYDRVFIGRVNFGPVPLQVNVRHHLNANAAIDIPAYKYIFKACLFAAYKAN